MSENREDFSKTIMNSYISRLKEILKLIRNLIFFIMFGYILILSSGTILIIQGVLYPPLGYLIFFLVTLINIFALGKLTRKFLELSYIVKNVEIRKQEIYGEDNVI